MTRRGKNFLTSFYDMSRTLLTSTQQQILTLLAKDKSFSKYFYLTGGTALSEYYLHHRISEDLDFFSEKEIDKIWLNSLAKQIKRSIGFEKLDIEESFNRNLVFFTDSKETIKTEFTYYPFTRIEKSVIENGIKIDSLIDIAVNKFFTIYQKPTARHFIDLYFIIKTRKYFWEQLEKFARIKFDTVIDQIQLGSQLIKAETVKDLPKMIIPISRDEWQSYFMKEAMSLKSKFTQ